MGVVLPSTSYQPTTAFLRNYWPCTFNEFDIKRGKSSSGRTMNGQWSNIQATSNQYKARTLTLGFSSVCSSGSAESISELPNTDDNPQVAKSSSGGSRIRQSRPIWARSLCFTTRARHRQASPPDEPVPCLLVRAQEHPHRIESSKLRKTTLVDSDRNKPCSSSKAPPFHALPTSRRAVPNQSCCHVRSAGPRDSSPGASPLALRAPGTKLLASGSDSPAAPRRRACAPVPHPARVVGAAGCLLLRLGLLTYLIMATTKSIRNG